MMDLVSDREPFYCQDLAKFRAGQLPFERLKVMVGTAGLWQILPRFP